MVAEDELETGELLEEDSVEPHRSIAVPADPVVPPSAVPLGDNFAIKSAVSAAQYGRLDELTQILDRGLITPNSRDTDGCTLLQWAAINNRRDIVKELQARGARQDDVGGFLRETALQWAVRQGALEAEVQLVKGGADPHITGTEGMTALHLACVFKQTTSLYYLCAAHPSLVDAPTTSDKGGLTPLMVLIQHWAKPRQSRDNAEHSKNMLRALLAFGATVNAKTARAGDTALHLAMKIKSDHDVVTVCQILIDAGASLDAENDAGYTPARLIKERNSPIITRNLSRLNRSKKVPDVLGFWVPWAQIFLGSLLTTVFGWIVGCASFAVACGALNAVAGLSTKMESRLQHGFSAGSIFFIVASGYVYLIDQVTPPFIVWYVFAVSVLVYHFVKTTVSDPGYVPIPGRSDEDPSYSKISESVMEEGLLSEQYSSSNELLVALAEKGELFESQICSTCLVQKPPRSKHDPVCGRCVQRFDHFCPFVYTAIGKDNIAHFVGFLLWCVLTIGSHLSVALPYLWHQCEAGGSPSLSTGVEPVGEGMHMGLQTGDDAAAGTDTSILSRLGCIFTSTSPALLIITILACFHWLWITLLFLSQIGQIMTDLTTYEAIRGFRARPTASCGESCSNLANVLAGKPTAGPLGPINGPRHHHHH